MRHIRMKFNAVRYKKKKIMDKIQKALKKKSVNLKQVKLIEKLPNYIKIKFLTEKKIKIRYLNCVKCNIRIEFKKVFYAIIIKISQIKKYNIFERNRE